MNFLSIPILIWVLLTLTYTSHIVLKISPVEFQTRIEKIVYSYAFGLIILSSYTFTLGAFGILNPWVILVSLIGVNILISKNGLKAITKYVSIIKTIEIKKLNQIQIFLVILFSVAAFANFVQALAPPTAADSMAYHLAIPKQYILANKLIYIPDMSSNGPLNQHLIYTFGMLLHQDTLSILLLYSEGLVLALAIFGFTRRFFGRTTSLLSSLIFYTLPIVTTITSSGHVEIGLSLFTFLAIWALINWVYRKEMPWLLFCGLLIGFAAGIKYYGLFSIVGLAILITLSSLKIHGYKNFRFLLPVLLFCTVAIIIASPNYIKTYIHTGNPVYPALYEIFGGRDWGPELNDLSQEWASNEKRPGGNSSTAFFKSFYEIFLNKEKYGGGVPEYTPFFLCIFPLVLTLFFLDRKRRYLYTLLSIFSVIFYIEWFWIAFQRPRHLLPLFPIFTFMAASVVHLYFVSINSSYIRSIIKLSLCALIGITLSFNLGINIIFNSQFFPVVSGMQTNKEYLNDQLWNYKEVEWINDNLTHKNKLIHFNRTINYYLEVPYVFASQYSQGRIDWTKIETLDQLVDKIKSEGITHVMIEGNRIPIKTAVDLREMTYNNQVTLMNSLLDSHGKLVYKSERVVAKHRTLNRGAREVSSYIYELDTLKYKNNK